MNQPLVSGSWYRVAPLRPGLAPGLRIVRQPVRDQVWHVLVEPGSGKQLRLNPAAYAFAGRCDGRTSVEELWQGLLQRLGEQAPTQDEIVRLLAQLSRAGMLQFDSAPNLSLLFARRNEDEAQQRRAFINPLALRARLFDPTRLLDALAPLAERVIGWPLVLAWLALLVIAALAAATQFPQLKAEAVRVMSTPSSYAIAWLAFPVVKALHELGHALAVRYFGGAVREVGVSLMLLTPAPYVDASAANSFPSPRQRAIVSAAGILVELGLAALAMLAWSLLTPGLVRDGALVVVLIGTVSTLLFNANPLLRLDGYHLLCDLLQLPNLALRSQAWWATQWRRLLGASAALPPGTLSAGEGKWLVLHAPASLLFRLVLLAALVFWVGHRSWLLGWIAALAVAAMAMAAILRGLVRAAAAAPDARARQRGLLAAGGFALAVLLVVCFVPMPVSLVARGVVWPPERAQLRPEAAGFVSEVTVADGAPVKAGETVLAMADPELEAKRDRTASERTGLLAQQYQALLEDPARAADLNAQVERNQAELDRAEEQLANLDLLAQAPGRAVWPREHDLPGSFAKRGQMLGYVLAPGAAQVRLVLADEDLLRVRGRVRAVEVRLADSPSVVHAAFLGQETPAATRQLPSAALGDKQGGPVAIDPADKDGLRSQNPVFLLDVLVPDLEAGRIGGRAWVKLELPAEPLGTQAMRVLRQLFLREFSTTGQA